MSNLCATCDLIRSSSCPRAVSCPIKPSMMNSSNEHNKYRRCRWYEPGSRKLSGSYHLLFLSPAISGILFLKLKLLLIFFHVFTFCTIFDLVDFLVGYCPVGGSWMNSIKRNMLPVTHLGLQSLAILALMALLVPNILTAYASSPANNSSLKNYQHVFIIMMENTGYTHLIGNSGAPWINSAAATYGLATHYTGVTHPSQPNYIAATSGSTSGVNSDSDVTLNVPNIVD